MLILSNALSTEFCISIQSDNYNWYEGNDWKTDPVKFKIGATQFEVGPISAMMVIAGLVKLESSLGVSKLVN